MLRMPSKGGDPESNWRSRAAPGLVPKHTHTPQPTHSRPNPSSTEEAYGLLLLPGHVPSGFTLTPTKKLMKVNPPITNRRFPGEAKRRCSSFHKASKQQEPWFSALPSGPLHPRACVYLPQLLGPTLRIAGLVCTCLTSASPPSMSWGLCVLSAPWVCPM